jgi:hypothetical protein
MIMMLDRPLTGGLQIGASIPEDEVDVVKAMGQACRSEDLSPREPLAGSLSQPALLLMLSADDDICRGKR